MRTVNILGICTSLALLVATPRPVVAQTPEPDTRQAAIEQAESQKASKLQPFVPTGGERFMTKVEHTFVNPTHAWHPFFENAYKGGGFAPGVGYMWHVSPYNYIDVRGSYSIKAYKRAEVEFFSPRLFRGQGELSLLGGWREATEVAFYGTGMDTSTSDRVNYGFQQPHASALLTVRPARELFLLRGGVELSKWDLETARAGRHIEDFYSPATLPGVDTTTTYLHSQGTVGLDWRTSSGYTRRGGFYGVTAHDYRDRDEKLGFQQLDYEVIQHLPILRETWVLSFHGLGQTTRRSGNQETPFFLLPSLGGGSNLRGYSSFRFRDRNSLLLQGEWRIMVNRFMDTALFYDAGQVATHKSEFDVNRMKTDYGFGVRFHAPFSTLLRVDVARSREGTTLVFATGPAF
jgi:hypothetical protein